jgi:spectrin alpha
VKKLVQKHQTFISELTGHESRVSETINRCQQLIEQLEAHEELEQPLEKLKSNWAALKENSEQRRVELDDALNLANYIAEAAEAEGWIREKEQIVSNEAGRSGKDEEATEAMLKRHSAVMIDIEAFGQNTVYGDLRLKLHKNFPI